MDHHLNVKEFRFRSGPHIFSGLILVQTDCKYYQQTTKINASGLFPAILGKGHWPNLGKKMIDLTSKLGETYNIEHNKGRKYTLKIKLFRLYYAKHTA